ncbi:hypothetical protein QFC22_004107 [Naganishia vaughanmartiniae]|uniref:Uncharacterized protein n=1 Tax=Naganishia vaughanmartiniae TaxID=1424756 RepID=A0ACC2X617_9TREE|nr:hypothetical protein QFC22_004107 [Naganishia vaughanmartiniae]
MKFFTQAASLLLLSAAARAASDVIDLTSSNFDSEVNGEKLALVEFFAPWCGHCKSLAPHYEEAATELKNKEGIKLAKVDCTENQELCQEHGVKGYPTLKVFREGVAADYGGPRKADGIISYMLKQSLPAITEVTPENHDEFKTKDKVVVIAYAKSENDVNKAFKSVSDKYRDNFLFGYATDPSLAPSEAGFPSIVMYKKFDEGMVVVPEKGSSLTVDSLTNWIKEQSTPLMDQVSPENFATYAEQGLPLAYLFIKPDDSRLQSLVQSIKPVAKANKGKINFVWIDGVTFVEHGKSLNVDVESYPGFVIQDMSPEGKGKKFVYPASGDKFNADALASWVQDFETGKLTPSLKSAPAPASQDEPVTILVGSEFDKIIYDDDKDVFVEFYAPWCGHCQRLAPIWDSLGEHFEDFKNTLTIAKMDATENDIPPSAPFEVPGFPTLKFKRAGTREFIDYNGDRSLEALISFVTENSNNPIDFEDDHNATEQVVGKVDADVEVEDEADVESGHHDEL